MQEKEAAHEDDGVRRGRDEALERLQKMGLPKAALRGSPNETLLVSLEVEILDDGEFRQFTQIGAALTDSKQVSFFRSILPTYMADYNKNLILKNQNNLFSSLGQDFISMNISNRLAPRPPLELYPYPPPPFPHLVISVGFPPTFLLSTFFPGEGHCPCADVFRFYFPVALFRVPFHHFPFFIFYFLYGFLVLRPLFYIPATSSCLIDHVPLPKFHSTFLLL